MSMPGLQQPGGKFWWATVFSKITAAAKAATSQFGIFVGFPGQIQAEAKQPKSVFSSALLPEGTLAVNAQNANASLAGEMVPQGVLSADLQKATALLRQELLGTIHPSLPVATAALNGEQTFKGNLNVTLKQAIASISGKHTEVGQLAATAGKASAVFGGHAPPPFKVMGTTSTAGTSITLPPHAVGNIIILWVYRDGSTTAPSIPAAGGTVPTWNEPATGAGTSSNSARLVYTVATATNHTSGTWNNATGIVAVVINSQDAINPLGGAAIAGGSASNQVVAPAITMSKTDGSSIVLEFYGHRTVTAWGAAPAGYTRQTSVATEVCCNIKTDTTSDGASTQTATTSSSSGYMGAALEILMSTALPTPQGITGAWVGPLIGGGASGSNGYGANGPTGPGGGGGARIDKIWIPASAFGPTYELQQGLGGAQPGTVQQAYNNGTASIFTTAGIMLSSGGGTHNIGGVASISGIAATGYSGTDGGSGGSYSSSGGPGVNDTAGNNVGCGGGQGGGSQSGGLTGGKGGDSKTVPGGAAGTYATNGSTPADAAPGDGGAGGGGSGGVYSGNVYHGGDGGKYGGGGGGGGGTTGDGTYGLAGKGGDGYAPIEFVYA